ncbi:MAG: hypothetical protein L0Y57_02170 [Beijerinckiaceae bacterium]|nr:hypothetical protein [Beijerinckiaceae bacterium]MCI0599278.1 hypothetical protein [Beijerinckiaceae bacterium]
MIERDRSSVVAAGGIFAAALLTRVKVVSAHQPSNAMASGIHPAKAALFVFLIGEEYDLKDVLKVV